MTNISSINSVQGLEKIDHDLSYLPQEFSSNDYFTLPENSLTRLFQGVSHQTFPNPVSPGDYTTRVESDRPDWISSAEEDWFARTGGLQPVASLENGTVTVKLQKPGLDKSEFLSHVIPYMAYKNTDAVQTSFECSYNGSNYFYTGTLISGNFTPAVTKYNIKTVDGVVKITWRQVDKSEALAVLQDPENFKKLSQNLTDAGVNKSPESYLKSISSNLNDLKGIWGSHEYDLENGYYRYQQHVGFTNPFIKAAVDMFGPGRIKGAALKVAYQTLHEDQLAGSAGEKGVEVQAFDGTSIRPDI